VKKELKNLPASVHARLLTLAKTQRRPFQEILQYYAIERFIARLAQSPYQDKFILKGGLIFRGQGISLRRPTKDVDFQAYTDNSISNLEGLAREICVQVVEADGMHFDPDSVRGQQIILDDPIKGVRVSLKAYLGTAEITVQIDISFSNVITPAPVVLHYPTLLDMVEPEINGYPFETVIAEKFQALVLLGSANDRLKDFYDLWLLSKTVPFNGLILQEAIQATFDNRKTSLPVELPAGLTEEFVKSKEKQWLAFTRKFSAGSGDIPDFLHIVADLGKFLIPILESFRNGIPLNATWNNHWNPN